MLRLHGRCRSLELQGWSSDLISGNSILLGPCTAVMVQLSLFEVLNVYPSNVVALDL